MTLSIRQFYDKLDNLLSAIQPTHGSASQTASKVEKSAASPTINVIKLENHLYSLSHIQLRSQLLNQLYSKLNSKLSRRLSDRLRDQLRTQLDFELRLNLNVNKKSSNI